MLDELAAAVALEVEAGDDALDVLAADVFEVEVGDDVPDEHPPISAAIAVTSIPHAMMRARSSLNMVLYRSFREKGP
jgi:hypothetical protein